MTQNSGQGFLTSMADKVEYSVKVQITKQFIVVYKYTTLSIAIICNYY